MSVILFDGWPLVFEPSGPAGMHLRTLLEVCPAHLKPVLALPGKTGADLPAIFERVVQQRGNNNRDGLVWEQRDLPRLARETGSRLIHTTRRRAALLGNVPWLISPAAYAHSGSAASLTARLRLSLGEGGASRAGAVLWPEDLVGLAPEGRPEHLLLPPLADPPEFLQPQTDADLVSLDLPETFVLYDGPGDRLSLRRLLDAWSWAAGPVGVYYPLVMVNLDEAGQALVEAARTELGLDETVRIISNVNAVQLGALYRGCSLVFHPLAGTPWGGALRRAMLAGRPIVGINDALSAALLGPAGYLLPPADARGLGAAAITVIVEEGVAESLSSAALERSSGWDRDAFAARLAEIYAQLLS